MHAKGDLIRASLPTEGVEALIESLRRDLGKWLMQQGGKVILDDALVAQVGAVAPLACPLRRLHPTVKKLLQGARSRHPSPPLGFDLRLS